jgi:hypothetical protein
LNVNVDTGDAGAIYCRGPDVSEYGN